MTLSTGSGYFDLPLPRVAGWTSASYELPFSISDEYTVIFRAYSSDYFSVDLCIDNVQIVPEPGTLMLLLTAGLGALAYAWHRRRS